MSRGSFFVNLQLDPCLFSRPKRQTPNETPIPGTNYFFKARPAMSFRYCMPSKCMHSTPLYALATASSSVGAVAVDAMTRPPEVLRVLSEEENDVPAWKRTTSTVGQLGIRMSVGSGQVQNSPSGVASSVIGVPFA